MTLLHGHYDLFESVRNSGVKPNEVHLTTALNTALSRCHDVDLTICDFAVSAKLHDGVGKYTFFIEFDARHESYARANADLLSDFVDEALCNANEYYARSGRIAGMLDRADVRIVKEGTFDTLRNHQLKRAGRVTPSQIKTPRVISTAAQLDLLERGTRDSLSATNGIVHSA